MENTLAKNGKNGEFDKIMRAQHINKNADSMIYFV